MGRGDRGIMTEVASIRKARGRKKRRGRRMVKRVQNESRWWIGERRARERTGKIKTQEEKD